MIILQWAAQPGYARTKRQPSTQSNDSAHSKLLPSPQCSSGTPFSHVTLLRCWESTAQGVLGSSAAVLLLRMPLVAFPRVPNASDTQEESSCLLFPAS